jgi:hypothetical protein
MNKPHGINVDTEKKKFKITQFEYEIRMLQNIMRKMLKKGGCVWLVPITYIL